MINITCLKLREQKLKTQRHEQKKLKKYFKKIVFQTLRHFFQWEGFLTFIYVIAYAHIYLQ